MAMGLDEILAKRPVNKDRVKELEQDMMEKVHAYRLRELRENAGLTQSKLADIIGVSQKQISKIERGNIENAKLATIRKYVEAVGGNLSLEYVSDEERLLIA